MEKRAVESGRSLTWFPGFPDICLAGRVSTHSRISWWAVIQCMRN